MAHATACRSLRYAGRVGSLIHSVASTLWIQSAGASSQRNSITIQSHNHQFVTPCLNSSPLPQFVTPGPNSSPRAPIRHPGLDPGSIQNSACTHGCRLKAGMTGMAGCQYKADMTGCQYMSGTTKVSTILKEKSCFRCHTVIGSSDTGWIMSIRHRRCQFVTLGPNSSPWHQFFTPGPISSPRA
jgi:hypothetical protein